MDKATRQNLANKGWKVGTAAEFLELSPAEETIIEIKLALADKLRATREAAGLTQAQFAQRLKTRQPNIARMELGAERSVTIDLLTHALLDLGVSREEIAMVLGGAQKIIAPLPSTPKRRIKLDR